MKETALQGKHTVGRPVLGYAVVSEGKYFIDEEEAKAVRIYLLSSLIWCGECGQRMVGASSSYHTRKSKEFRQKLL
jgi:hypothetical protein